MWYLSTRFFSQHSSTIKRGGAELKDNHSTDAHLINDDNGVDTSGDYANDSFTSEQEELFRKWYWEEYDLLIDPDYIRWIRIHHPE